MGKEGQLYSVAGRLPVESSGGGRNAAFSGLHRSDVSPGYAKHLQGQEAHAHVDATTRAHWNGGEPFAGYIEKMNVAGQPLCIVNHRQHGVCAFADATCQAESFNVYVGPTARKVPMARAEFFSCLLEVPVAATDVTRFADSYVRRHVRMEPFDD